MTFSIIIPTYNSGNTVKNAIESVLSQTFTDFEILIIDGLSKDDTISKIQGFEDSRIKIVSEKDNGIYDAMNKGIKKSNGEWLYFLGSDDCLFDKEVLRKIIDQVRKTESKIIYGNVLISNYAGWAKNDTIYDGEFNLNKILIKNICHQSIFYHKEVFKKLKEYQTQYKICADYDFNLKAYSIYKFEYVNLTVAKFAGGGLSIQSFDENFDLNESIIKYFQSKLFYEEFTFLQGHIKSSSKKSTNYFNKIYLFFVYLKHRICA